MYNSRPGLLIGFHGCDKNRQQELLEYSTIFPVSDKPYDWLGHGMYFWENNYDRALEWAQDKQKRGLIKEPAVIGAVLDLSYCCDLLESKFIRMVATYFRLLKIEYDAISKVIPENRDASADPFGDKLIRLRDCATIEFMHQKIRETIRSDRASKGYSEIKVFDSVRGMFPEGKPAYDGSGFQEKSHIQICIRNPNCIKGFFLKREEVDFLNLDVDDKIL